MEPPLERDVFLTEQPVDDRDALVESVTTLVEAHAEPLELVRQEGACESDLESTARDRVEHADLTRELQRVVEDREHRAGDEPHRRRPSRRGREEDERVRRVPAVVVEVVLDSADVREPEGLGLLGEPERLSKYWLAGVVSGPTDGKNCTPNSIEPPRVDATVMTPEKRVKRPEYHEHASEKDWPI